MGRNPKVRDGIRIAAGVYLIYLAYQIIKGGVIEKNMTGASYVAGIIFSILFIVIGGALVVNSFLSLLKERSEEAGGSAVQAEPSEEEGEIEKKAEDSAAAEEAGSGPASPAEEMTDAADLSAEEISKDTSEDPAEDAEKTEQKKPDETIK